MSDERDDEISRLLRLKRFEQPPPEYFENFLHEFHRRQREELLRQPLWRIAWDRMTAFFNEQTASNYAYGAATALVLLAATITSLRILNSPPPNEVTVAQNDPAAVAPMLREPVRKPVGLRLSGELRLPDIEQLPKFKAQSATASLSHPRYVMDARPVSYEPASSF